MHQLHHNTFLHKTYTGWFKKMLLKTKESVVKRVIFRNHPVSSKLVDNTDHTIMKNHHQAYNKIITVNKNVDMLIVAKKTFKIQRIKSY